MAIVYFIFLEVLKIIVYGTVGTWGQMTCGVLKATGPKAWVDKLRAAIDSFPLC